MPEYDALRIAQLHKIHVVDAMHHNLTTADKVSANDTTMFLSNFYVWKE